MAPGVEEEILLPALPVVRPVLDGPGSEHIGDSFQELERNQIEARLAVRPRGAAGETPHVTPVVGLDSGHSSMLPQR